MSCPHYDIETASGSFEIIGKVRKLNDGIEGGLRCRDCGAVFSWYHVAVALQQFGSRKPNKQPMGETFKQTKAGN